MKNIVLALLSLYLLGSQGCVSVKEYASDSKPIEHKLWDELVRTHVSPSGDVDYKALLKDSTKMNQYLELLRSAHPNKKNWTRDERLAYWINAYNAFTVKLILDNYPLYSIKDIKEGLPFISDTWTIEFIQIEGKTYHLNHIEHGIIRPRFEEPRIHFAVNCASISCPKLRNEAYTAARLEEQLSAQARDFLANPSKNQLANGDTVKLSKIFDWFKGDFKKNHPSVLDFINEYAPQKISKTADVSYLDYNWQLNDVGTAE
ncbi:MAG: DUF547 domain-containing protein [Bacteroidota bacterium]